MARLFNELKLIYQTIYTDRIKRKVVELVIKQHVLVSRFHLSLAAYN